MMIYLHYYVATNCIRDESSLLHSETNTNLKCQFTTLTPQRSGDRQEKLEIAGAQCGKKEKAKKHNGLLLEYCKLFSKFFLPCTSKD